jgi:hypothetical protein
VREQIGAVRQCFDPLSGDRSAHVTAGTARTHGQLPSSVLVAVLRCRSIGTAHFQYQAFVMSHAYGTRTFTVASHELPSSFASLEEFEAFARKAGGEANARAGGLHDLWGSTRSGWAIYTTRNLLRSAPTATALQFLSDRGHAYRFETEYGFTAVSVLDAGAIAAAAEQLDQLLSVLRADPARACDADEAGMFSDGDAEAALARDYLSATPAYDSQVRGDEGEGADYLFTYLRSILALLRAAQGQKLSVVHSLTV